VDVVVPAVVVVVEFSFIWTQSVNVPAGTVRVILNAAIVLLTAGVDAVAGETTQVVPTENVAGNVVVVVPGMVRVIPPALMVTGLLVATNAPVASI